MIDIFYELINEASLGKVILDGEEWPIGFNTIIDEDNTRLGFEVEDYIEENIESLSEEELQSNELCLWPFSEQSMVELALWLNGEFMKNVAEIVRQRNRFRYSHRNRNGNRQRHVGG